MFAVDTQQTPFETCFGAIVQIVMIQLQILQLQEYVSLRRTSLIDVLFEMHLSELAKGTQDVIKVMSFSFNRVERVLFISEHWEKIPLCPRYHVA